MPSRNERTKSESLEISHAQAEILLRLLSYGEIEYRRDGYFDTKLGDRFNGHALRGLIARDMIRTYRVGTMPSAGYLWWPRFDEHSVTKKGCRAFREFLETLPAYEQEEWLRQAKALGEVCEDQRPETEQEELIYGVVICPNCGREELRVQVSKATIAMALGPKVVEDAYTILHILFEREGPIRCAQCGAILTLEEPIRQ